MPLIETKGAASAQGFGEFSKTAAANWIEDCFSCFLYTGTGSGTQTITNGIDLAGEGGLVWIKSRTATTATTGHALFDTARGREYGLATQLTGAQQGPSPVGSDFASFNSNGFTVSATNNFYWTLNPSGVSGSMVSWTFRKQPKFFDVVTYTGNGSNRTIAHSLGSVPGCIIVKRTDTTGDWQVYHRSTGNTKYLVLNSTAAEATSSTRWNDTTPTSTEFSLGTATDVNANSGTYVAYLFAHDAGGFGPTGTDNVITCGYYTGDNSSEVVVNLGYEPQWLLIKRATNADDPYRGWTVFDNMRGMAVTGVTASLIPNSSDDENSTYANSRFLYPTATGFNLLPGLNRTSAGGETYIYVAIRRGPMKTPTTGTSVFNALTNTGTGVAVRSYTGVGFPPDTVIPIMRTSPGNHMWGDRLRGSPKLDSTSAAAEDLGYVQSYDQNGWTTASDAFGNNNTFTFVDYVFRRAPGFFDVVCYTGTGSPMTISHNLGVSPEFAFTKSRNATGDWDASVFLSGFTDNVASGFLNGTNAFSQGGGDSYFYPASSTTFTRSSNVNGRTYVAYLFATCPGVSKVGSYTGTGNTLQIDCGFTGGARFVLIKRTNSTGDWYVWDSARGIVAGSDPYLTLNTTAAEVTNTDWVDTYSAGFELSSAAGNDVNINAASYIFLSIA